MCVQDLVTGPGGKRVGADFAVLPSRTLTDSSRVFLYPPANPIKRDEVHLCPRGSRSSSLLTCTSRTDLRYFFL
ncbi:hypothetical protein AAFF_G00322540 [Aldrovandia affinis]|uniref:Uncharacterized protein n=1 Tax=Aldrovandia affinis TaxID=143900 RepID=A0AAD7SML9_9TELE|nr:hypothetical protein AAFF_G00322540 [Aldrovandia affinis]